MTEVRWLADYSTSEQTLFRIGRAGDELVAEWIGLVRLVVRRDGSEPRYFPEPSADPRDLAKIKNGSGRLLLRHLEGKLALHGSAVAGGDHAVVMLGRSGQGKSTLAASLCARDGVALCADDAVAIDEVAGSLVVVPAETLHWLDGAAREALGHDAAEAGKQPLAAARVRELPARLVAIVELVFVEDKAPRLVRARGLEALAALVPQAVRFVLDEPALHRAELESLTSLVNRVPVYRLLRPRDLDGLSASAALVHALLESPRE